MNCCTECTSQHFDDKIAQRDLNNYKNNGAKKSTQALISTLKKLNLEGLHLLDIGAGIGMVSIGLQQSGLSELTHNDISPAYLSVFKNEFGEKLHGLKVNTLQGDFVEVSDEINNADIVVLDKSICCYPNYHDLVHASVSKANTWYAYVIPRDTWWVKLVHYFMQLPKSFKSNSFRSYIYPVDKIEQLVLEYEFEKHTQTYQREWLVAVFKKV